jgi:phage tail sheath gpL-like
MKLKGARMTDWIGEVDTSKVPSGFAIELKGYGSASAVTQPVSGTAPVVGVTGMPIVEKSIVLKITTGGTRGTAEFDYSLDGGSTYSGTPIVTGATVSGAFATATGLTATFATGTYVLNDLYSLSTYVRLQTGGKRARFGYNSTGTGVDDVTTLLTNLVGTRWGRIAPAQADATQAQQWEDVVNDEAGPLALRLEHLIFGHNGTLTSAVTLGQTTLNAYRAQLLVGRNIQTHPAMYAAGIAAKRAVTESTDPVPDYDCNTQTQVSRVKRAPPQQYLDDRWTPEEEETLLNAGCTPLRTLNNEVHIVRAIVTHCLTNSAQDERCLDVGDAVFPDFAMIEIRNLYENEFRPANKYVAPDPSNKELEPPANVGTPRKWNSALLGLMLSWTDRNNGPGWIEDPSLDNTLVPQSAWNAQAKRIQSLVPLVVRRIQHQMLVTVRQQAAPVIRQ